MAVRDVLQRDLDVFDGAAVRRLRAARTLVLVQEREAVDQGEIFFVIAPGAGALALEGERGREGVEDLERTQEPLRVAQGAQ